jgi:MFS family permease
MLEGVIQKKNGMARAMLWTSLLSEPLFTLYSFLTFILYKDLGASAFAVSLLVMLKPLSTILSFYWSAGVRGKRLKSNVLWAGFWMRAPFLLCTWLDSVWFVIAAAVNYMFFYRAGVPAWMEWIKRNMKGKGSRAFSWSAGLGYAEGVVLSMAMGGVLDRDPGLWKGLFFGAALVGLLSLVVQGRVGIAGKEEREELSWKEVVVRPWRDSYQLMKSRPDFAEFQWGFMLAGFGIMLIQPALALFAVDVLEISHLEMAGAVSIAKGLGYVVSSPVWGRWLERTEIMKLSCVVFVLFGVFPLMLSLSIWSVLWFYAAYFLYGVAQGGSHLVWNLSGPMFAGKEESARYSGVNVVMGGARGVVAPPLGGALLGFFGPVAVLVMGGALCVYSGLRFMKRGAVEKICLENEGKV